MRQINFKRTHINEISQHIDNLFTDQQATMISSKTLKHIRKKDDATNQNTSVVLEAVLFKMHGLYIPHISHFFYKGKIFGEKNLHRKTPIFRVKSVKNATFSRKIC